MSKPIMKLLIVDDEPAIRGLLAQVFTALGHSVRSAEDGFSALEQIRESMPDVILSDLNMPGMSGFELLSVVRRRLPAIFVVATSGAFSGSDIPNGIAADAFYEKASGMNYLLEIMKSRQAAPPSERHATDTTTVWISWNGSYSLGEQYVTINCPECLRSFPQIPMDQDGSIRETDCMHCSAPVHYAVVKPVEAIAV